MKITSELPKITSQTDSIGAGATADITITIPSGEYWKIKSIVTTLGANTTINSVSIDGVNVGLSTSSIDLSTEFGALAIANSTVVVNVTSADVGAQNTTVDVRHISV